MATRFALLAVAGAAATLSGCSTEGGGVGFRGPLEIVLFGVPVGDTLRQTGLEFSIQSDATLPYKSVDVVVDPGTASQRTFSPDAAWLEEGPERFPVVVPGPLPNGSHLFELRVEDANGRRGSAKFTRVVKVPSVAYTLQFLGAGFDDSRAAGITPSGLIAGTLLTGVSPSQVGQIVAWNNGVRSQPRTQANVTTSSASNINNLGEIIGTATVSGSSVGVFWRGDSLEVLKVNDQSTFLTTDIDESHRALVLVVAGGLKPYFLDVHSNAATQLSIGAPNRMNGAGQIVYLSPQLYGTTINTVGGVTIKYVGMRPGRHERQFRGVTWDIFALNDRGDFLGTREGDPFLSHDDTAEYLDQRLPRGTYRTPGGYALSPAGDVVVVAGNDSLYVWSKVAGTRQLSFTNSGWKIDGLVGINVAGQLVAHGVNLLTNEKGALLLSPVSASARQH
jgi:hypothetical protein